MGSFFPAALRDETSSLESVYSGGENKVVLRETVDSVGKNLERRVSPTESDLWVMSLILSQFANPIHKCQRLPEITKPELPPQMMLVQDLPLRNLLGQIS